MKEITKLLTIGLLSPLFVVAIMIAYLGAEFLPIAMAGYPIMVVVTYLLLFALSKVFKKHHVHVIFRYLTICILGAIAGGTVYIILFIDPVINGEFRFRMFAEYAVLGLVTSFVVGVLYNFGPTKVEVK